MCEAGRKVQIESVALCEWQCRLRNVSTLSNRTHLVVNRDKTKVLDMRADKSALGFLGYEFRYVKDRR